MAVSFTRVSSNIFCYCFYKHVVDFIEMYVRKQKGQKLIKNVQFVDKNVYVNFLSFTNNEERKLECCDGKLITVNGNEE